MLRNIALALLFACSTPPGRPAAAKPTSTIVLPGGEGGIGFDDLRYAPELHRVLVPAGRSGKLDLVDPTTQAVESIAGFSASAAFGGGHGQGTTSVDAGDGMLFAIDRDRTEVAIIDLTTKAITSHAALAGQPDYVRWVAPTREIWVTEPRLAQIEYFTREGTTLTQRGTIAVPGGPESLVVDATRRRAYTHTWDDETVVIDLATHAEVARWKNGCKASRGIALDEPRGLLFVGCEEGKATALDVSRGTVVGAAPAGTGVDIIAYSPARSHLYVPGGDAATLTLIGVAAGGALHVLGTVPVAEDAHCATTDDAGHVYVCAPKLGALQVVDDLYPATR